MNGVVEKILETLSTITAVVGPFLPQTLAVQLAVTLVPAAVGLTQEIIEDLSNKTGVPVATIKEWLDAMTPPDYPVDESDGGYNS